VTDVPVGPALRRWPHGTKTRSSPTKAARLSCEVVVPAWIMSILYSDLIASGMARSGEIRFEPESGLGELPADRHNLTKRVILL
jgi:hypothetical protein